MDKTRIEWADATWNPVFGCSLVSTGCEECYAMGQAHRFSGEGQPYEGLTRMTSKGPRWTGKVRLVYKALDRPIRWRRPRKVFVNSMSDLFHENVPDDFIDQVFAVMALADHHIFQILTKRPQRMRDYFAAGEDELLFRWARAIPHEWVSDANFDLVHRNTDFPLKNVWMGVSVENQATANERIPLLLETPAAIRWLSCEPLLGCVDLSDWMGETMDAGTHVEAGEGFARCDLSCAPCNGIDWVVAGGESGPKARPMHPHWALQIRDTCNAMGVPFFFKQWGAFAEASAENVDIARENYFLQLDGTNSTHWRVDRHTEATAHMVRVGKHASGRQLDGREWNEVPAGDQEPLAAG